MDRGGVEGRKETGVQVDKIIIMPRKKMGDGYKWMNMPK